MTKNEFESNMKSLVGETIQSVYYYEVVYDNDNVYWNSDLEFDSLDYGLDLKFVSGKIKGLIWGSEFYQYGISLVSDSLANQLKGSRKIDVTEISRWKKLIGSKILNTEVIWSWVKEQGIFKKKIYYPQDLVLTLSEGNEIFISALEIQNNLPSGLADNITVFFEDTVANKYGVGFRHNKVH